MRIRSLAGDFLGRLHYLPLEEGINQTRASDA
jgi:hypothetical protein